jgi:hypothetical protein
MSVKIRERFRVTDGIGVEDGQHSEREREYVNGDKATTTRVAGSG